MSVAKTLASATGTSAAYAKHATLAAGIGGKGFVADFVAETKAAYLAKDAELAERRAEMRALAANSGAVPKLTRQRKLAA